MPNPIQYDNHKFTLSTGQTNYDVSTNVSQLFDNVTVAKKVVIKTDQTITVRFNNVNLPVFEIVVSGNKNESPFQLPKDYIDVTNIFITNASGETVNLEIMLS